MKDLTSEQALAEGYMPLTVGYTQKEKWMFENAAKHLLDGKIECCRVKTDDGSVELWRKHGTWL